MSPATRRGLLIGAGSALVLGGAGYGWTRATGSMETYRAYAAGLRRELAPDPKLADLVRYAALAANSHNTQPWRFRIGDGRIDILPDFGRRTPAVDPDDHHLYVSLGCAAENLVLAAQANGLAAEPVDPAGEAVLAFAFSPAQPVASPLYAAIPARQSTRGLYDGREVPAADLAQLAKAATEDGVALHLVTDRAQIGRIRDLIVSGNDLQLRDSAFVAELRNWLRFSPRSAMATGDGLFAGSSGNPLMPDPVGRLAFDLLFSAADENEKCARQVDSSAGLAIFAADAADPRHWMQVGRACQRFSLQATALGLKLAFMNQPVEVASLRPQLAELVGMPGQRCDLVMRFGYGAAMPPSARRPVAAILA